MRQRVTAAILALCFGLGLTAAPALALDTCALSGPCSGSLVAWSTGGGSAQVAFRMDFSPNEDCDAVGAVELTYVQGTPGYSEPITESYLYAVLGSGILEIGNFGTGGVFGGQVGNVKDGKVLNISLVGHPNLASDGVSVVGSAFCRPQEE